MNIVIIIILFVLVVAAAIGFHIRRRSRKQERESLRISPDELRHKIAQGEELSIIDLRHPLDVLAAPQLIPGAVPIAPKEVEQRASEMPRNGEVVLYCTCPNEETSLNACRKMRDLGFTNVKVLTGGLPAWKRANLPLENLYPELEQQVRARAGNS